MATGLTVATISSAPASAAGTGTLTQSGSTSGTGVTGYVFRDQLSVTGAVGTVTFASASLPAGWSISSDGQLVASGSEAAGAYALSGTVSDTNGDTGTWSYSASILGAAAGSITQSAPTSGTAVSNYPFADQLNASSPGLLTYSATNSFSNVTVSYGGAVTATGQEATGSDALTGYVTDTSGDVGTWSYTLTVNASSSGSLTQAAQTSATFVAGTSGVFPLSVSGATGNVDYSLSQVTINGAVSSLPASMTFSSAGSISVAATVTASTYVLSGLVADTSGDVGTWSYTLNVQIAQVAPTSGTVVQGTAFSGQLATSDANTVTYGPSGALPSGITVSSAGLIQATSAVPVGTYNLSGTTSDTASNTGTWTFILTVTNAGITQTAPTSGTVVQGTAFSGQLATSDVNQVAYAVSGSLPSGITVSGTGAVAATTAVPVGTYNLSGTTQDLMNNTGTWAFTLTVTNAGITQTAPTSGTVVQGTAFSGQLATSDANTVSYAASGSLPTGISVSSAGVVAATTAVPVGTYNLSGTTSDTAGNTGTWAFTLTVTNAGITQTAPTSGTVVQGTGTLFQLATSDTHALTYAASGSLPTGVAVSATGAITVTAATPTGVYKLAGSVTDLFGNSGTWAFTLTVNAPPSALVVTNTSGTVMFDHNFTTTMKVLNAQGTATFTKASGQLTVGPDGTVTLLAGDLGPGTYTATGSVVDASGNTGSWTFSLTVTSAHATVGVVGMPGTNMVGTYWAAHLTSTSGAVVSVRVTTPYVCEVVSGRVLFTAAGSCRVVMSAPANQGYTAALAARLIPVQLPARHLTRILPAASAVGPLAKTAIATLEQLVRAGTGYGNRNTVIIAYNAKAFPNAAAAGLYARKVAATMRALDSRGIQQVVLTAARPGGPAITITMI